MSGLKDDQNAIPNDTRLFRRINPEWIVYDKNVGRFRPTSQNFQDSANGTPMSVFAENIAKLHGESAEGFLRGHWSSWYLVAVIAGRMRELSQDVYPDLGNQPADDFFHSHAAVEGPKDHKTRSKLAKDHEWIVVPPNQ